MDRELASKYELLKKYILKLENVAVAFSSGTDSALLLKVAHDVLGENAIAITLRTKVFPAQETLLAQQFCDNEGIRHLILDFNPLDIDGFSDNPQNRCYICKKVGFSEIIKAADENGIVNVIEGSNMDDNSDYRPGLAAIRELNILSPLQQVELTKKEIRLLSKELGLITWNKPSKACLASRFTYGEKITEEKLLMIDKAEQRLMDYGFMQSRVRIHGMIARIEILPEQMELFMERRIRKDIYQYFKQLGFSYITLDIEGFRSGSMNEELSWKK